MQVLHLVEESGFEALDRKGICFGTMLEEESVRGTAEDEERTSVGRDKCMEGGLEGSDKTCLQERGLWGMSGWASGEEEWLVREPESVEESSERNCFEESSGKVGNWEDRITGEPKTASAGGRFDRSWGVDL
jgi:hypothetical protein